MKTIITLMALTIAFQNCFSQSAIYEIDSKHTERKIREFQQTPKLFAVVNKEFITKGAAVKIKKESKDYIAHQTLIKNTKEDSLAIFKDFNIQLKKYNEVNRVKSLVDNFLSTQKPFELKKHTLIEAQKLALNHNIKELIYADSKINSAYKSKFFLIKMNELDLKIHLKKVTWSLNKNNIKPERPASTIGEKLKQLREKSKTLKRYYYIERPGKNRIKTGLAIGNQINGLNAFEGEFKKIKKYYLATSNYKNLFKKGQLIEESVIKKLKLSNNSIFALKTLIKNISSNKTYISAPFFLDNYAFMINGKYQASNKTLLIGSAVGLN